MNFDDLVSECIHFDQRTVWFATPEEADAFEVQIQLRVLCGNVYNAARMDWTDRNGDGRWLYLLSNDFFVDGNLSLESKLKLAFAFEAQVTEDKKIAISYIEPSYDMVALETDGDIHRVVYVPSTVYSKACRRFARLPGIKKIPLNYTEKTFAGQPFARITVKACSDYVGMTLDGRTMTFWDCILEAFTSSIIACMIRRCQQTDVPVVLG